MDEKLFHKFKLGIQRKTHERTCRFEIVKVVRIVYDWFYFCGTRSDKDGTF